MSSVAPARRDAQGFVRAGFLEAAFVGGLAGILFVRTAARDLAAGDSGELLLAARSFGIPHPPGYPLWVWLAGLIGRIPLGPFPFRVAMLSVISASVGLAILYLLMRKSGLTRTVSAACTLALGFTPQFWSAAGSVEVYALAFAVDAAAAWAACSYVTRGGRGRLFACSTLVGLALVSHQSAVVFLPVLILALARRFQQDGRPFGAALGGLGMGLVPLAWLPLRSAQHPLLDWGHDANPAHLISNLSRACYGELGQHPFMLDRLVRDLRFFVGQQCGEWGTGVVLAGAAGLAVWTLRNRRIALWGTLLLLALPVGLAVLIRFEADPTHAYQISQFLLPLSALLAVAIGHGIDPLARSRFRAPVAGLLALWVIAGAALHYRAADQHDFSLARHYGHDLISSLPRDATLFVEGDNETFSLAYLQLVEGVRPDVRIIQRKGYVFEDLYGLGKLPRRQWALRQREVEAALLPRLQGPVFCTGSLALPAGFKTTPWGLLSRVVRGEARSQPVGMPSLPTTLARARNGDYVTRKMAVSYLEGGAREALREGTLETALEAYRRLAYVAYDFPEAHYNLSRLLLLSGRPHAARDEFFVALLLAPREPWIREEGRKLGFLNS